MALIKRSARFIAVVMCAVVLLLSDFSYAMNDDYLSPDKWEGNPNVTLSEIHKSALDYTLDGIFGYYIDYSSMCIYTYFAVNETTVNKDNKDIRAFYEISVSGETYTLELYGNGFTESSPQHGAELFKGASAFYPKETCIINAAEYKGKAPVIEVSVSLYVNGHIYRNIAKDFRIERPTTVKQTTTKKVKTTKAKTKKSKKSKASDKSTTKFVPKGKIKAPNSNKKKYSQSGSTTKATGKEKTTYENKEIYNEGEEFDPDGQAVNNQISLTTEMSKPSLLLLLLAIILATAGITLLITSAVLKKNKKQEERPAEDEEK